jgi:hypothetical protein
MRVASLVLALAVAASPSYGADPAAKCAAAKRKAAGKKIAAKMTCYGKAKAIAAPVEGECLGRAERRFSAAFLKAGAACGGDARISEGLVDRCVETLLGDVPGDGACPSQSARIVGKWGAALMRCAARDELASAEFASCDAQHDARYSGALARAGACAAAATHSDLHEQCVVPLVVALPPATTATTTTITMPYPCFSYLGLCQGSCGPGETCGQIGFKQCGCFTPTSCQGSSYPTCGGECPAGYTCYPVSDPAFNGCSCAPTGLGCASTSLPCGGAACPPGLVCFTDLQGCTCAAP